MKFGVRVRTWDTLPALNFVKIAQGDLSLVGNFYQKFKIFAIFSYLSPYFYYDNIEILLKRTDLGIQQQHKISSKSLKGPAGIALPRGGDAYWFLVFVCFILSCFWNYEVSDNGNAMNRCNFQNSYGVIAQRKVCSVIAQRKVCSCAPIFNFFL